jgi:glycosyltransferase involved in cell wall biosynthesis
MIVKNEENVIERSLRSAFASSNVTSWCIVDTGSTDKTIEIIHRIAKELNKEGVLYERPWVNFGVNRTEALQLASASFSIINDWLFMLDADDVLCGDFSSIKYLDTTIDGYTIPLHLSNIKYRRTLLFNSSKPWVYKFPIHEYPYLENCTTQPLPPSASNIYIQCRSGEGARSKNPNKYADDAILLEEEYQNPKCEYKCRAAFYAAQSWRDAGNKEKAIHWYKIRISLGGWAEEQYICYLNIIRLSPISTETNLEYAWKALALCQNRKEVTHSILEQFRKINFWSTEAYALGLVSYNRTNPPPTDSLFLEQEVYDYKFYDEFSVYAYYTGYDKEAIEASHKALEKAPLHHLIRIRENIRMMKPEI